MSISILLEDVESDRRYRQEAKSYVTALQKMKKEGFDKYLHKDKGEYYLIIPGAELSSNLKDVVVIMAPTDKRPAEGVYSGIGQFRGPDYETAIVIYNMTVKIGKDKIWGAVVLDDNRLLHEFIHLADERRSLDRLPSMNADGSITPSEYYNNAHEFNAYYQEGIAELEDTLETMREKVLDFYEEKIANFDEFLRLAKMRFDDGFLKHLNVKYNRKLKKRLYQYWKSLKEDI
jgi:hypothetical protein